MPSARKDEATLTAGKFKDLREDLADRVGEEVVAAAEKDAAAVVVEVPEVDLTGGKGGPVYVVQVAGSGEDCATWTDFARVTAPVRSKRKTIIQAAMRSYAGPRTLPATVRVLDADAAREHPVGLREREPELVIG
jgi:hypothetical protein